MTKQEMRNVETLVGNGWNYKQAIKYVVAGTPPGIIRMYSKPLMAKVVKAIKAYEHKHGE